MNDVQLPWFHIQFERLGFGHPDALLSLFSNLLQHTWTQFISWAMLCIYACFIYTSRFLYPSYSHDGYEFKLIKMPNLVHDKFMHIFHGFWSIKGLLLSMPYKCDYNTSPPHPHKENTIKHIFGVHGFKGSYEHHKLKAKLVDSSQSPTMHQPTWHINTIDF